MQNELLVGSDDADIRIYKDEDLILQIAEADVVVALAAVQGRRFAYALQNGTIGVYEGSTRLWRVKSKHSVSALTTFDLNGDGRLELISGWSNGKVEARNCSTGDVVGRDGMSSGVAGVMTGALRDAQGEAELLAVSTDGEMRGYVMQHPDTVAEAADVGLQQQTLVELAQKKQALIYELSSYQSKGSKSGTLGSLPASVSSVVPTGTRVDSCIALNRDNMTCELVLKTNNDSIIKAAVLFGEQVFLNESLFVRPAHPSSSLTVPLSPARNTPVVLLMKVLVGSKTSSVYHVFELEMEVPKYVMYAAEAQPPAAGPPASCVSCVLQHPMSRLQGWVETRFSTKTCISSSASRCVFQLGNLAAGVAIISGLGQQTGLCRVCRSPILQLIGSSYLSLINYIIN
jgi:Bardet-Biedl syndrome 2 protein